jgi:hypothetical protein
LDHLNSRAIAQSGERRLRPTAVFNSTDAARSTRAVNDACVADAAACSHAAPDSTSETVAPAPSINNIANAVSLFDAGDHFNAFICAFIRRAVNFRSFSDSNAV